MRAPFDLRRAAVLSMALGLLLGCGNKKHIEQAPASAAPTLADLPEPAGVAAELRLNSPDISYRALRELGRPMSALLPTSFQMAVATALGLPPLCADSFDPGIPAVGAVARNSKGDLGWVAALHAVSGRELVAQLSTGDHAPFRAHPSERKGLTLLDPSAARSGTDQPKLVLGVFDNYLLVSIDAELLASVGPYAARMLPRRPASNGAFALTMSQHALASEVVPAMRAAWGHYRTLLARQDQNDRLAHGGRAPDFADPAQLILALDAGVESGLALLDGAARLELDVDPAPERLEISLLLQPAQNSSVQTLLAGWSVGDAQSLLSLPADTRIALGLRAPRERDEAAKGAGEDWARLLGPRLAARDAQILRSVLADWELGRGPLTTYGFMAGADSGAFLVSDVSDPARLKRAGHGFFGLLSLSGVRAPLVEFLGQPQVSESVAVHRELGSEVQLARIAFAPHVTDHAREVPSAPLGFAWFVAEQTAFAAASLTNAEPALKHVTQAARGTEPSLSANPAIIEGVRRMADQAALFGYADARLGVVGSDNPAQNSRAAPLFLSLGKHGDSLAFRLEISQPAVGLGLSRALGL